VFYRPVNYAVLDDKADQSRPITSYLFHRVNKFFEDEVQLKITGVRYILFLVHWTH